MFLDRHRRRLHGLPRPINACDGVPGLVNYAGQRNRSGARTNADPPQFNELELPSGSMLR